MLVVHNNNGIAVSNQRGFTLIEVLVAIVVLSIGILGLIALESATLRNNQSAYYRSQATILIYDMADKMRRNMPAKSQYTVLSPVPHTNACISYSGTATPCDADTIAEKDLYDWNVKLASILPSGTGSISESGDIVTISVAWDDDRVPETDAVSFAVDFQL